MVGERLIAMESGPGLSLTILDYHTLLQHSSISSEHALPSEPRVQSSGPPPSVTPTAASLSEIGAGNSAEAAEDQELCLPRGELRVGNMDDSSSTSAEELASRRESKDEILEEFLSDHGDEIVGSSLESEDALAQGRDLLVAELMGSLGPGGCGLLAVRGVPEVAVLRKRLLPFAKKLALMPDATRRPILKNYGLTSDVPLKRPDRPVSAFATKLQYARHSHAADGSCILSPLSKSSPGCLCNVSNSKDLSSEIGNLVSREDSDLEQLGSIVRQLGARMVELGLLVARLCDSFVSGADLEDAILESGSAKARLIHYHAFSEKDLLSHSAKIGSRCTKKGTLSKLSETIREFRDSSTMSVRQIAQAVSTPSNPCTAPGNLDRVTEELWQEWHYDYGILTVLTAPLFLSSPSLGSINSIRECESYPGGHTGLKVLSRGVDNFVCVPPDCLIVQVGEAAQIASGGKLAAVAHCVGRPPAARMDISRETFVTFLQPAWDRVLSPPMGVTRAEVLNLEPFNKYRTTCVKAKESNEELLRENGAKLACPRPLPNLEEEVYEKARVVEERNLEFVDRFSELMSQKKANEYIEVNRAELSNFQIQSIFTAEFRTLGPDIPDKNFLSQGSARANNASEHHVKLSSVVPSLDARWKEGCTFAEFARETTAQYYGVRGRQSQRTGSPVIN